jgi:hypothetical protein
VGLNASDFTAIAFSALPAGSMQVVLPVMASAALTTSSAPPHLYMLMPKGSTSLMSVAAFINYASKTERVKAFKGTQVHWPLLITLH